MKYTKEKIEIILESKEQADSLNIKNENIEQPSECIPNDSTNIK